MNMGINKPTMNWLTVIFMQSKRFGSWRDIKSILNQQVEFKNSFKLYCQILEKGHNKSHEIFVLSAWLQQKRINWSKKLTKFSSEFCQIKQTFFSFLKNDEIKKIVQFNKISQKLMKFNNCKWCCIIIFTLLPNFINFYFG